MGKRGTVPLVRAGKFGSGRGCERGVWGMGLGEMEGEEQGEEAVIPEPAKYTR